jgi:hypothetical protein
MGPAFRKASVANNEDLRKAADARRRVLAGGLAMVGVAAALWLAAAVFKGEDGWETVVAVAPVLARWALLVGALLLFLYFAVRKATPSMLDAREDPTAAFGQTTTMFHDPDLGTAKAPAGPPKEQETQS